jgi:hypothetical protein
MDDLKAVEGAKQLCAHWIAKVDEMERVEAAKAAAEETPAIYQEPCAEPETPSPGVQAETG